MPEQRSIDHSRLLDVHRFSDHPEVNQFVNDFWQQHLSPYFPTKQRGPRAASSPGRMFKVLFLDLYVAWLEDPNLCISISRTDSAYKVGSRYNLLHISKKIIDVVDALLELGFIEQKLGTEGSGKITRIWPLEPLVGYFKTAAFSEFLIDVHADKECIVLTNKVIGFDAGEKEIKSTVEVEYEDKEVPFDIAAVREELRAYNALLRQTQIDIGSEQSPVVTREHFNRRQKRWETRRISLRHDNKFVRRIFYRENWNLGGRYHGGWWQQIPSELRKDILINDQHTVEVDYSGFHVSVAYGLEGLQPPKDPYSLDSLFEPLSPQQQREAVKLLVLTAINAENKKSAFAAFRDEKNREQRHLPKDQKIKFTDKLLADLLNQFIIENQPIAHYLCADKGVELMAIDGRITTRIISHFTHKKVPVLTVHDSYVVQSEYEQQLIDQMTFAARAEIGDFLFRKKQEQISSTMLSTFRKMDNQINVMDGYQSIVDSVIRTTGYRQRYGRFARYLSDHHLYG